MFHCAKRFTVLFHMFSPLVVHPDAFRARAVLTEVAKAGRRPFALHVPTRQATAILRVVVAREHHLAASQRAKNSKQVIMLLRGKREAVAVGVLQRVWVVRRVEVSERLW